MPNYHIVFNPLSGGGRTAGRRDEIVATLERSLGRPRSLCFVERPDDGLRSTRQALLDGCETIVAVGGDGTIQNVARGFFRATEPINPAARLGVISTGTGRGLAQSLGITGDVQSQVDAIASGSTGAVDMVAMSRIDGSGRERGDADAVELFINECQFGLGGAVVRRVRGSIKRLGGLLAFGMMTVVEGLSHRAEEYVLSFDDGEPVRRHLLGLVVGNGSRMGGGMTLVPGADPTDGRMTVLSIHDMPRLTRVRMVSSVYDGSHVTTPHFSVRTCERLVIRGRDTMPVAADGEVLPPGGRSLRVLPGAIRVALPKSGMANAPDRP